VEGGTKLWLSGLVIAVVVLGTVGAIEVWHGTRRNTARDDCTVVEQLAHQYIASKQSVTTLESGPGDTKDLIAIADSESAMSDKIRSGEARVSASEIKDELEQWAQGTALSAKLQRDAVDQSQQPSDDADFVRAGKIAYNATAALHVACPNMPTSQ
jgi:hypothetical protein